MSDRYFITNITMIDFEKVDAISYSGFNVQSGQSWDVVIGGEKFDVYSGKKNLVKLWLKYKEKHDK